MKCELALFILFPSVFNAKAYGISPNTFPSLSTLLADLSLRDQQRKHRTPRAHNSDPFLVFVCVTPSLSAGADWCSSKSCFRLVNFLAAYEANAACGSHFCQIAEGLDEGEQDGGSLVHFADANLAGDCQLGCWASSLMV